MNVNMTQITVDVPVDRADAFSQLWRDFLSGDSPHDREAKALRTSARDARERGIESLRALYAVAQRDSGQCRYVARFLAGLYNGFRFPFDLTDLRCLDSELFEHCMNVLRMDARPAQEVHLYFENGGAKWEQMIQRWGLVDDQIERARSVIEYADSRDK